MAASLIKCKGIGDILVAGILTIKPSIIYDSLPTQFLAGVTGLHMSNAAIAPGFNQAIASMVAAIGVGDVVAAYSGPAARPSIFAMNLTWGILCLATCLTPRAWDLGSATVLMSGLNHLAFSVALYFVDPSVASLKSSNKQTKLD